MIWPLFDFAHSTILHLVDVLGSFKSANQNLTVFSLLTKLFKKYKIVQSFKIIFLQLKPTLSENNLLYEENAGATGVHILQKIGNYSVHKI